MSDVFISYKRENLTVIKRLVEALRAEGLSVWWDQDIPAIAPWEATIERELTAAKLVIVAWSPEAVASENVKAEARWARTQGRLLQVFVGPCDPPLFFGERQGADLNGWSGEPEDAAFRLVLDALHAGLEAWSGASTGRDGRPEPATVLTLPSKPSIAVLPFANLSGDSEQDYFADGMVVEIVQALSRIRSIFVIASGSSLTLKGRGISPQEAGRQLGVRYVLDGNVRRAADRVRIGVQLIDATDGAQVWTHRFDDTLEDVFDLQEKVAIAVAGQIEPTVYDAEVRRATTRPTDNMSSYDLFLRATPLMRVYGKAQILQAFELLNRAIALDPDHAAALMLAATCRYIMVLYRWSTDPDASRREGVELTHRALRASHDDPDILARAGFALASFDGDLDAATLLVDRAATLNPGSAIAQLCSGVVRMRAGDQDLAVEHFEATLRLDPIGSDRPACLSMLGMARLFQGRFAEAAALEKEVAQLNDALLPHAVLAASEGHLGHLGAARSALARFRSLTATPIEDFAHGYSRVPAQIKMFLDGIALAEGPEPA
jgi:adenylate cyclase